jgi:hypothetical protein
VRQDLDILIDFLKRNLEEFNLSDQLLLPYQDPVEMIFRGLRALLDDQVAEARPGPRPWSVCGAIPA